MDAWIVCFDITDDRARRTVGRQLARHGRRVQRSVFEILVRSPAELDAVREQLRSLLTDDDDLRFYPLCRTCRTRAHDADEMPAARFAQTHVC